MKKLFLTTAAVLFLLPVESFSQEIEWQNTIGGSGEDELRSVLKTSDGGFILAGGSSSGISGDKSENSMGMYDYWVVKINSQGNILWQNTIGGSYDDYLLSVDTTSDGGYILGGSSGSNISGDKSENCIGGFDYWIVKLDSIGNIQWQNTIGGNSTDYLSTIKQASDGGYILGGRSESPISGDKNENNIGLIDLWVVKTDSLGVILWENTIGGNINDFITDIIVTNDGGFLLGCYSNSNISGDKTQNSYGNYDFWVIKLDSLGNIQWQNTIGGSDQDQLNSLIPTLDGGFILGGFSRSDISGVKTKDTYGDTDYWIVKIDSIGNIQWQNDIGGSENDLLLQIEPSIEGGYLLSGYSISNISGTKTEGLFGIIDFWVVNTDSAGNIIWQNTIGASGSNWLFTSTSDNNNGFLLGGFSDSNISGDKTENSNGGFDFWIVKISNQFNVVTGDVFIDLNLNNIPDSSENPVKYHKITDNNSTQFAFTNSSGFYSLSVIDTGTIFISPTPISYYLSNPLNHSSIFSSFYQVDSMNDFAFQPTGVFNDLCVTLTPIGPFRPGFNASYQITYENVGTTTLTPTVIFFPDNDVSFVSSTPSASAVTIDSSIWNFGPLTPFQSGSILITVNVTTSVPIGTSIISEVTIEPVSGDANPSCNQSFWEVFTTGSYDPNDILVNEDTLFTTQFPNTPYLEYLIRFQNTGNDTAFIVKVLNPIDTLTLDLSTFEFVSSSHQVNLSWIPWERNMQFQFDNILLPDSNINEPASHGFIRYRIKPKSTLDAGDSISNYAAIYFDFNAPVITNTAITRIVLPTFINEIASRDRMLLYPNPANTTLNIEIGNVSSFMPLLVISDVAGRIILSKTISSTTTKHIVDISSLSRGIYFVQLEEDESILRGKFVRE